MTESARRFLLSLRRNLPSAAATALILFYFILIPLSERLAARAGAPPSASTAAEAAPVNAPPAAYAAAPAREIRVEAQVRTASIAAEPAPKVAVALKAVLEDAVKPTAPGTEMRPGTRKARKLNIDEEPEHKGARGGAAAYGKTQGGTEPYMPADVTRGDTGKMDLSFTFDGGYNADEAEEILDALKERGIRTTIFLTGLFIQRHPGLTRRIVDDGHEVGNHTMTHPHLTEYATNYTQRRLPWVTREFFVRELRGAERAFLEVTGRAMAPLWRAPYGEVNGKLRAWALQEGYLHVGWTNESGRGENLDTLDWVHDTSSRLYLSTAEIREKITGFGSGAHGLNGGIVLMHLGTLRKTDRASGVLGPMLDELEGQGYRFVKVSELIRDNKALETARMKKAGAVDLGSAGGHSSGGPS